MDIIDPKNITHYHIFDTHYKPLSYSDLLSVVVGREKTLNLSFEGAITKDLTVAPSDYVKVELPIIFNEEVNIFSLIDGGWLPLPFVNPPHFLIDSNVIINLEKIKKNLHKFDSDYAGWWLQILNSSDVIINPILYAFEGKECKTPKLNDFIDYFEDSIKTIQKVLPNARLITFNSETYTEVYKIIENSVEKREKQTEFLLKINPLLINHISSRDLLKVESEILNIAKSLNIKLMSLTVLATLSCLYEANDNSNFQTARKILKFSPKFNEAQAFNALSDLGAVELFAGTSAVSNVGNLPQLSFCTCDKAIALFCCAINLRNKQVGKNGLSFNISATKELFPVLNINEIQELVNRLSKQ